MWGLSRGFEVYDDATDATTGAKSPSLLERRGDHTVDRALAWLDSHSGQHFFLWVHLYDPHSPYRPPEPYRSRYAGHLYDGEIAFDDEQVGRIFVKLRRLELYDGTLIAIAGDHGESLGEHSEAEHGFFIYDATLRVPLILKLPGRTPAGVVNNPVGLADLAPAIAELCGIPAESTKSFQGHSFVRMINHEGRDSSPSVYAESGYARSSFGWHELRAVITPQFKYIDAPRLELYDLNEDPGEKNNLASARPSLAAALRETLESLAGRFASGRAVQSSPPLDSETLEKLRALGYVGYQAPPASGDSRLGRVDPKDKIGVVNRLLAADNLRSVGRFAEAEESFATVERSEPDLYIVAFERGENLLDWGKTRAAVQEFHKALTLNPSFDQAWAAVGRAAFALGEDKEASEALQVALRLNPRNYLARRMLARVYWHQNQPKQAELELAQVVREQPNFGEARSEHGIALVKLRKYQQALAELRAAPNLGYRDAIVFYYLGIAYSETGDEARAIEAYEKAVELDPHYGAAYLNLAFQYRKRHEISKARQYYREACRWSPELCHEYSSEF
jgi:tetratricopeptide (TPR) repeat protein